VKSELKRFPVEKELHLADLTECRPYRFVVKETRIVRRDTMGARISENLDPFGVQVSGLFVGLPDANKKLWYDSVRFFNVGKLRLFRSETNRNCLKGRDKLISHRTGSEFTMVRVLILAFVPIRTLAKLTHTEAQLNREKLPHIETTRGVFFYPQQEGGGCGLQLAMRRKQVRTKFELDPTVYLITYR
jgi:hypothetical protein